MTDQADLFPELIDAMREGTVWWAGNWQCRNWHGYFQHREGGRGHWCFVIQSFGGDPAGDGRADCTGSLVRRLCRSMGKTAFSFVADVMAAAIGTIDYQPRQCAGLSFFRAVSRLAVRYAYVSLSAARSPIRQPPTRSDTAARR